MKVRPVPFIAKASALVLILAALPLPYSIIICIFVTWVYQYLIAWFYGVDAMPSMDTVGFLSEDTARTNIFSVTEIEKYDYNRVRAKARENMIQKLKLRSHIVEIFGDYYWKETRDVDQALA